MRVRQALLRSLPWVALLLMAALAFSQLHARRQAERRSREAGADEPGPAGARQDGAPAGGLVIDPKGQRLAPFDFRTLEPAGRSAAVRRAEDEAQRLEAAWRRAEAERHRERARLERAHAELDVQRALLQLHTRAEAGIHPDTVAGPPSGGTPGWLEDLLSGVPSRASAALERVAEVGDSELLEVAARCRDRQGSLAPARTLLGVLPGSHRLRPVLLLALLGEASSAEAADLVHDLKLGAQEGPRLLAQALDSQSWQAASHLLVLLAAADGAPLDQASLGEAVARALRAGDPDGVAAATVAQFRLEGHAPLLVSTALADPPAAPRRLASALHALARTGAPEEHHAALKSRLRTWLGHPATEVAVAGLMLGEQLLGRRLDLDPWAPPAERAAALAAWPR